MKSALAFLAVALLLPLAGPTSAQTSSAVAPEPQEIQLLQDNPSDVKVSEGGQEQDGGDHMAAIDLRGLTAKETPESILLVLTVASLKDTTLANPPTTRGPIYGISFRHRDQVFRATVETFVTPGGVGAYAYLETYDSSRHTYVRAFGIPSPIVDLEKGTFSLTLDRDRLADRKGDTPHPEVPLTDWHAAASSTLTGVGFGSRPPCLTQGVCLDVLPSAHDAMPDTGNGTLAMVLKMGIAQSGHARLSSNDATRASNGEATTIVYQVEAQNRGKANETFGLTASGLPVGWSVRLPAQRLKISAGGHVLLPVVLSVPFTHLHGTYQHFLVEMKSLSDAGSVGRIQLGIRYTNPPQPAGHHDTLYVHATPPFGVTGNAAVDPYLDRGGNNYMNALEPELDAQDAKVDSQGYTCSSGGISTSGPHATYCWFIPLSPQLELGLDFDLDRIGTISIPFKTTLPLMGATLAGSIMYYSQDERGRGQGIRVANLRPTAGVDLQANTAANILKADILPLEAADYIPYSKVASLQMQLLLVSSTPDPGIIGFSPSPALQPGGIVKLPLNEYHDKVAQVFASNSTLQLTADGAQDRFVNPGKAVLFNLTLLNNGPTGDVSFELTGTHAAWAHLVAPGASHRLETGKSVAVRVAVQVPDSADKGDTADLVLSATSASDLNVRSLARLFATVATDKAYPDDTGLLSHAAPTKTPGLEALAIAPVLLALAALARRKRQA